MDKPVYIKNAKGGVHSVTEKHYKALLEEDGTLPKNWAKLTEAEAKKAAPALFGLDANGQPAKAATAPAGDVPEWAQDLIRALAAQTKDSGGQ